MTQTWSALLREVERTASAVRVDERDRPDLVQETLLRVWERVRQEDGHRPTSALVRTVMKRLRIDLWRRRREQEGEMPERAEERPSPLEHLESSELSARMMRMVADLPENQRQVVQWRLEEELSFKEIADRQGVPLGTALGRMHLAMKRMRKELCDD